MSFTWQDGRKLASLTGTGISANYVYNGDGLRTQKTVTEGTEQYTVEYFYEGNKLIALERVQGTTTDYMFFLYDQSDNIVGFELNGTAYYYSKNLQGDVLSILDSNGDIVVKYTYTAWGELVSVVDGNGISITDTTSVAYLNPIRYRGYVYDDEIGMYYLQSRYYDPSISRFINVSCSGLETSEYNPYRYCRNNPAKIFVNTIDDSIVLSRYFFTLDNNILNETTYESSIYYDVPLYNQGSYSLCWAFCQVMVEDWKSFIVRSNESATLRAIEIAIKRAGSDEYEKWNKAGWPSYSSSIKINSIYDMYGILKEYGPVYAYYYDEGGAHLVVVTGIDMVNQLVYTNNPWGVAGYQTFKDFQDGFLGHSGTEYNYTLGKLYIPS